MLLSLVGLFVEGCQGHEFCFILLLLFSSCRGCRSRGGAGLGLGIFWDLGDWIAVFLCSCGCRIGIVLSSNNYSESCDNSSYIRSDLIK